MPYNEKEVIFQARQDLPDCGGRFPVLGSWLVDGKSAGLGIREGDSLITGNTSRFIPHVIS